MESFTHESDNSSSCTQSDGDSTNSSNGANPFLLCPRGDSLQSSNHGRLHADTDDIRPYKLARIEPSGHLRYRASALTNPQGVNNMPYAHGVIGGIHRPDGMCRSGMLPHGRSYTSSALEDCRGLPVEFARSQHAGLPYIGAAQNFFPQNQWPGLRQQNFAYKPIATGSTPASTLLLPLSCKVDQMPINFGSNSGNFYLGLTDPQPGRCRRTDGKKWRCGRAVVPEQKYCERHMHRGRGRSKAAKLAKVTTTAETIQPHDLGRPLNQPLIQLLSQLTVPVEPVNQPSKAEQQPTCAGQPLKWLQKSAQTFQLPHSQLPYLAQPLFAEQLSQFPIQSKTFDWPLNQSPMQAEPLNLGQSNGRPPLLAQAIPMNAIPEVKISPDRGSGLAVVEASRMHSDDPNDVLNLDVQGIKRLLENAPCSRRSDRSLSKPKQLPNVADLLNVAHIGKKNIEPRKPSSLIDVLKMVDSSTSNSMRTSISTVFYGHSTMTSRGSVIMPSNICRQDQDSPDLGNSGTPLSLTVSDNQTPKKQSKQYCNSPSSLDLVTVQGHNDMMSLKLFNGTGEGRLDTHTQSECRHPLGRNAHEGPLPNSTGACAIRAGSQTCHTSETSNGRHPELEGSKSSGENLFDSEKTYPTVMQEKSQSAGQLHKVLTSTKNGNSESAAGSSFQGNSANVDINSCTQSAGGINDPRSLMMQENGPNLRKETSNEGTASPKSDSGSLILLEESLDVCDFPGKSEGFFPSLTEKSLDKHEGVDCPDINSLVSRKTRVLQRESYGNLDMNIPILVVKDDRLQGKGEPAKANSSSKPFIETLQTKAALDRSSSGSSCNVSSLSKSTSSFDPPVVSNPEPLSPISLAN